MVSLQHKIESFQETALENFGVVYHVSDLHSLHSSGIVFARKLSEPDEIGRVFRQYPAKTYNPAINYARESKGLPDTYMAVNAIAPFQNRSNDNVTHITGNYVDLDCYKFGIEPEQAVTRAFQICAERRIPVPTVTMLSGRGVYLLWLYEKPDYVGKKSKFAGWIKTKFVESQESLIRIFSELGADPACKDLARILRLADTTHSKTGATVTYSRTGQRVKPKEFRQTLEKMLPKPEPKTATSEKTPSPVVNAVKDRKKVHYLKTPRTLAYTRMRDLRELAKRRGGRFKDHRAMAIFYFACSAAQFCNTRESLLHEVSVFMLECIECDQTKYNYTQPEKILGSLLARHQQTRRAKLDGELVDVNYRARNETIIAVLEITPKEQKRMRTIIGKDEIKYRDAKWHEAMRRKKGIAPRAEYEAKRQETTGSKAQQAIELKAKGMKAREIAASLGVSVHTIYGYFKN